jgi:hypothetical protein
MARAAMEAGDAVWGFYGHKSDSELVGSYGFTCAPAVDNAFNSVELVVDMDLDRPSTSALASFKHVLLRSLGLASSRQSFLLYKGTIPPTLILFLTMDACNDEHGEGVLQAAAAARLVSVDPELARELLRRAYRRLVSFSQELLRRYPTSLIADLERVRSVGASAAAGGDALRKWLALMLRLGGNPCASPLARRPVPRLSPDVLCLASRKTPWIALCSKQKG